MTRLPNPGGDTGTWGDILNQFLDVSHNSDGSLKSSAVTVAGAASDSSVVHNSGNETIGGVKTFSSSPVVPTPTNTTDAANKTYVDSTVSAGAPDATTTNKGIVQLAGDLAGTATSPTVAKVNGITVSGTPSNGQVLTAGSSSAASWSTPADVSGFQTALTRVSVTSSGTSTANTLESIDTTSGSITRTLPNAPADKTRIAFEHNIQGGTNTVTFQCAGSDVIDVTGGATSGQLVSAGHGITLAYNAAGAIWSAQDDRKSLASLDTVHSEGLSAKDPRYGGAKGNVVGLVHSSISSGTNAFSDTNANFVAADQGKTIVVPGAGTAGAALVTTISGFTDSHHVTLTANASTTISSGTATYGTDDSAALQAWLNALSSGGRGWLPQGRYMITTGLTSTTGNLEIVGAGNLGQYAAVGTATTEIVCVGAIVGLTWGTNSTTRFQGPNFRNFGFNDITGTALGGLLILRANNFLIENVGATGFAAGYGIHSDGTGNTNQYGTIINPSLNNCFIGLKQTATNGLRVFGGMLDGNGNSGSPPGTGSTAIEIVSGDTPRYFGTVIQFYDTGIDINCASAEIISCRFEGVANSINIGAVADTRVIGCIINNYIWGGTSTGITISASASKTHILSPYIVSTTTPVNDLGGSTSDTVSLIDRTLNLSDTGIMQIGDAKIIRNTTGQLECLDNFNTNLNLTIGRGTVNTTSRLYFGANQDANLGRAAAGALTTTGTMTATAFIPSGLTGATAASRYVGATTSGAPSSGTFAVGDYIIDQTGVIWVCTAAGTPGTWGSAGGGVTSFNSRAGAVAPTSGDYTAALVTNAADKSSSSTQTFTGNVAAPALVASGLTGATAASRYIGATTSGAPASGAFVVGDYCIDRTGAIWVCTSAGNPGTWISVGSGATPAVPTPAMQGLVGWSHDPWTVTSTRQIGAGTIFLIAIPVPAAISITNALVAVTGAGSGLTSGQNFLGVYYGPGFATASGTLLASSSDLTATWGGTGITSAALSGGPYTVTPTSANAIVWVAALSNGTTTPTVSAVPNSTIGLPNVGTTTSKRRAGTFGSSQTSFPSSITPTSMASLGQPIWAAIS